MKLSETLTAKAEYFRSLSPTLVAVDMLKKAGMSEDEAVAEVAQAEMEKSAAVHLSQMGIDYDTALSMVKVAGVKFKDLGQATTKTVEEEVWESLTKLASEAATLEDQVAALQGSLVEVEKTPESFTKLAESGNFTNEDLEAMMKLPTETLTKIAEAGQAPWSMGKAAGLSQSAVDPLLAFCLGD